QGGETLSRKMQNMPSPCRNDPRGRAIYLCLIPERPEEAARNVKMGRWIAYRGETIPLERYVTEPAHSLLVQSLSALESAGSTNGDGFGLGWYGEREEPGLYREVRPAWSDENLKHLCRHIRSPLFF